MDETLQSFIQIRVHTFSYADVGLRGGMRVR